MIKVKEIINLSLGCSSSHLSCLLALAWTQLYQYTYFAGNAISFYFILLCISTRSHYGLFNNICIINIHCKIPIELAFDRFRKQQFNNFAPCYMEYFLFAGVFLLFAFSCFTSYYNFCFCVCRFLDLSWSHSSNRSTKEVQ